MAFQDIVVFWLLPFVLIFVLVFAILQKSKLFGDDKKQIDALIGVVIGVIFVAVPGPHVEMVISMLPILAIALVVILIFFLIWGFFIGKIEKIENWMKWTSLVLAVLFVIGLLYYLTPLSAIVDGYLSVNGETFFSIVIFIVILVLIGGLVRNEKES